MTKIIVVNVMMRPINRKSIIGPRFFCVPAFLWIRSFPYLVFRLLIKSDVSVIEKLYESMKFCYQFMGNPSPRKNYSVATILVYESQNTLVKSLKIFS